MSGRERVSKWGERWGVLGERGEKVGREGERRVNEWGEREASDVGERERRAESGE